MNSTVIEVGFGHFPPLLFSALRFPVAALLVGGVALASVTRRPAAVKPVRRTGALAEDSPVGG